MIIKVDGDSAVLQSRVTPQILAILPRLEGRRAWLKEGGLKFESTPHNLGVVSELPGATVLGVAPRQSDDEFFVAAGSYQPKGQDYEHQLKAASKIGSKQFFGLFMEQGTGKSRVLINWAGRLYASGKITGVIVVSKKGVHRQWVEAQLEEHLNCDWSGAFWPLKGADDLPRGGLQWLAFNYDGLKTPAGLAMATTFAKRHHGKLLIIADESQEIKNHQSARHKAMEALKPYSSHRGLATGTPIAKDLTDEWAQLRWLDDRILGVRYLTSFRAEYCIMGGYEGRAVVAHKNIQTFKAKVDPFTFRATKDEIGILPKQYAKWTFDLTKAQLSLIKRLKDDVKAQLDSGAIVNLANAAAALTKFQQIASGFVVDEDGTIHRLMSWEHNPRVQAALEWLDAEDGKAIIWARYREDMAIMAEALGGIGVTFAEYHGGTSDSQRKAAVDSFMSRDGIRVFLANPQAAGTGLNLQGLCQRALYYTNSFNAIDRWQSEDRIHRIGTNGAVTYTDLIAAKSPDKAIIRNLLRKKGLSDMVLSDIREIIYDF
jgi:hypothetical protein